MQKKSFLASSVKAALYGTAALMSSFAAHNVTAQTTEQETPEGDGAVVEVIEVKGIRGALATAAELKRESATFVDSITSSDASALPDLSVAEALSRVPGVTVTKFDIGGGGGDFPSAEGTGNLIRGLGLIRSELNGRDAFTANGGRALDWSSIPPQLIRGVDVYKNQTADLIEGGIGGSINLRTVEPFDNEGLFGVVAVEGTHSDLRSRTTPQFSGLISNRWKTNAGEFGAVGLYSYSELESEFNGYQSGAIIPVEVGNGFGDQRPNFSVDNVSPDSAVQPQTGQTVGLNSGFQLRQTLVDRERESIYLAGQWQSNDRNLRVTTKYVRLDVETFDLERTLESFNTDDNNIAFDDRLLVSDATFTPFTSPGVPQCGSRSVNDPQFFTADGGLFCDQLVAIDGGLFEEGVISSNENAWFGAPGLPLSSLGIGRATETTTDDLSLNVQWRVDDNWYVEFDAHRTNADRAFTSQWVGSRTFAELNLRPDIGNPQILLTQNADFSDDGFNAGAVRDNGTNQASTDAPITSLADPNGAFLRFAADEFERGDTESTAARIDVTYEFDDSEWFRSVKFGARRSEREQVFQDAALNWQNVSEAWNGGVARFSGFENSESTFEVVDFSDFQRGGLVVGDQTDFLFASSEFLRNPASFAAFLASEPDVSQSQFNPFDRRNEETFEPEFAPQQTALIDEDITNFYVRLDYGVDFDNGMYIDGNIGIRYVGVDTLSIGSQNFMNTISPGSDGIAGPADFLPETVAFVSQGDEVETVVDRSDDFFLPSFNLKLNLTDSTLVRLGVSRGLTLPNINDLRASQNVTGSISIIQEPDLDPDDDVQPEIIGAAVSRIEFNGGNPNLQATTSNNYDISLEWYGESGNSASLSFFHKNIKNIVQQNIALQFDEQQLDGTTVPFFIRGPVNQASAEINGFEVAGQYFFDEAPGIWSNFGIQANYTFLDVDASDTPSLAEGIGPEALSSQVNTTRISNLSAIIGQSENFANLVGIYQDDKLEVRLAWQWRDEFLNSLDAFVTGNPNIQDSRWQLDASVRYNISDNLKLRVQGTNLTDEDQSSTDILNNEGQTFQRSSFLFDRRVLFGLEYSF